MIRDVYSGSWIRISDPDLDFLTIPDPGSRGQKGTGSGIRIRNIAFDYDGACLFARLGYLSSHLSALLQQKHHVKVINSVNNTKKF
jgi:hypothetical protein